MHGDKEMCPFFSLFLPCSRAGIKSIKLAGMVHFLVNSSAFFMPTSDDPDVVVEVRRSLLSPVRHCLHHGPGLILPPLFPHSYTAPLPTLDLPEAATNVVRLKEIKPTIP